MGLFKDFLGVVGFKFKLGGDRGAMLKTNQTDLTQSALNMSIMDAEGLKYIVGRAANINQGGLTPILNDLVTLFDLKSRVADVSFAFNPAADHAAMLSDPGWQGADGAGHFGFCRSAATIGSNSWLQNRIYYDKGSTFTFGLTGDLASATGNRYYLVPVEVGTAITNRNIIIPQLTDRDWLYICENPTTVPPTWTKKCWLSPTTATGGLNIIAVPFAYVGTDQYLDIHGPARSSTPIPDGAVVVRTIVDITDSWSSDNTSQFPIKVAIANSGITLMDTAQAEFDDHEANPLQYDKDELQFVGTGGDVVEVSTTGVTQDQGSGTAYVIYGIPLT